MLKNNNNYSDKNLFDKGTGLVAEDMCKHGLFRFRNVQIEDSDLEIFGIF